MHPFALSMTSFPDATTRRWVQGIRNSLKKQKKDELFSYFLSYNFHNNLVLPSELPSWTWTWLVQSQLVDNNLAQKLIEMCLTTSTY